jgi:hypothetical protein
MATMAKSSSSSSLRVAGVEMSHIPKRATQHSVYLPGYELQLTCLKPGQLEMTRQVYTQEAKDLDKTHSGEKLAPTSVYDGMVATYVKPEDYMNPTRPIRPTEPPEESLGHQGTGHWRSEYKSAVNDSALQGAVYHRQTGPSYQAANPPTCIGRPEDYSTYQMEHGKTPPLDKVIHTSPSLPVFKHALTFGTPKGTMHMPGYQGFLPYNTANPHVARVEKGENLRITTDKTNLTEQFHKDIPNYGGHVPLNPFNDKGPVRMNVESCMGRSFQNPASATMS